jgi:hypothetical protein
MQKENSSLDPLSHRWDNGDLESHERINQDEHRARKCAVLRHNFEIIILRLDEEDADEDEDKQRDHFSDRENIRHDWLTAAPR